jgi:peroxiredoxin
MKPKNFLLALSLIVSLASFAQSFTYTPLKPKVGDKVSFTYNKSATPLALKNNLEFTVFFINFLDNKHSVVDITPTNRGNIYSGSFVVPVNANQIAFNAKEGEIKDDNKKNGYFIAVYDTDGKELPGANYTLGSIISNGFGEYYFGTENNIEKGLMLVEKDWDANPNSRNKMMGQYFSLFNRVKKKDAEPIIIKSMEAMEAAGNLTENDYGLISSYYTRFKQVDKSAAVLKIMKEKYPNGNWTKNAERYTINAIADLDKRMIAIDEYIAKNPAKDDIDKAMNSRMYSTLVSTYANNKAGLSIEKLEQYATKIAPENKASIYNSLAWTWAHDKDTMYSQSEQLSNWSVKWAKQQLDAPTTVKPDLMSDKMWYYSRNSTYSMYTDTYANALFKLKDYNTSLKYAEIGGSITKWKQTEYNDRYAQAAEKLLSNEKIIEKLSPMIADNTAGKITKEVLKNALVKQTGSAAEADKKMTALAEAGNMKAKTELAKKIMNEEAVDFNLKNMQGNNVRLADLKGKVVVIDFWATWCGPCKVSFPGMQKTIDKYKNRSDVAFVFIDTWESQDTQEKRTKEVTEFIAANKYTFNVLYDEKDEAGEYKVVTKYKVDGIPTKFIIGKDGKVKFKSVGGDANADKLMTELSEMIEMASN